MRALVFATFHGDYSTELAISLSDRMDVSLLIDEQQASHDCGPEQLATFRKVGKLYFFSRRGLKRIPALWTIGRICLASKPDLCLTHAHYNTFLLLAHFIISRFCPIYLIVHDPAPHKGRDSNISPWRKRVDRWGAALSTVLLAHGNYCVRELHKARQLPRRPVLNVPHGPIMRAKTDAEKAEPPFALMFGRMEAYKGLDNLLAACRLLAERGRPVRCKLMGRGPELQRLRSEFEAVGTEVDCRFVPREEAIRAIRQSSIVLAPYSEATQSGVVAAAFAGGRPVLATAVGGLVDFIEDGQNGLLVPAQDPVALAGALEKALVDRALCQRLAAGAAQTANTTISWERYVGLVADHAIAQRRAPA